DIDVLRRRMERAAHVIPRLRQRVMPAPANLSPPVWVDDPDFDIDLHVRRIACPQPGTLRQVLDIAALFVADPWDRTRPMGQIRVVERLRACEGAVAPEMRARVTGAGRGSQLSLRYRDFAPDAPPLQPMGPDEVEAVDELSVSNVVTVRGFVAGGLRIPIG